MIKNNKYINYKKMLEEEQTRLIESMSFLGHMTNEINGDWIVSIDTPEDIKEFDTTSDRIEEVTTNEAILETLEERMADINTALNKIENGKFGICEKCDKIIEEDKLKANPASKYCLNCEIN